MSKFILSGMIACATDGLVRVCFDGQFDVGPNAVTEGTHGDDWQRITKAQQREQQTTRPQWTIIVNKNDALLLDVLDDEKRWNKS